MEGANHTHPVVIRAPPVDLSLYDGLIQVMAADRSAKDSFWTRKMVDRLSSKGMGSYQRPTIKSLVVCISGRNVSFFPPIFFRGRPHAAYMPWWASPVNASRPRAIVPRTLLTKVGPSVETCDRKVRRECVRLGAVPVTGPVHSIDHRCRLLQMKVVDFHRKQMLVYESQRRQQWRADILPHDAAMLKSFARHHRSECLRHALEAKDMDRICLVVESGADPATELRSGLFPLMTAVLKRSVSHVQRLLAAGADINFGNSMGMTALMWAVKRDDYAMVDALLEEGADVGVEGCLGWTAMSIASRHGRRDIAQLIVETLRRDKISGEMNATRALNHRSTVNAGLTPLMIAAIHRNEAMARCLMRLGAKPGVKCYQGYVAGEHAAKAGWTVFGLWLQETQAFGDNGVYTFADMKAESALRVAAVRMLDAISSGATVEDDAIKIKSRPATASTNSRPGSSIANSRPGSSSAGRARLTSTAKLGSSSRPSSAVSVARETAATSAASAEDQEQEVVPVESVRLRGPSGFLDVSQVQLEQVRSNTLLTVSVLQEGRAAPDAETDSGHTALISAVYRGRKKAVRSLVQEGADPNYSNRNGRTALMAAAAVGDREMALVLLGLGADAAWLDIHGKIAGAYAFERGFNELAELLAVAASDGPEAAVNWEMDRACREEEEAERQRRKKLLDQLGGLGADDVAEADLHDWMLRVTRPREAARLADKKQAALDDPNGAKEHGSVPHQHQRRQRCPKCTLFLPCLHFAATTLPDGVPEWSWNMRRLKHSVDQRIAAGGGLVDAGSGGGGGNRMWWKPLHQAHRNRVLPPAKN